MSYKPEDKKSVPAHVAAENQQQSQQRIPVRMVRWERPLQIPGKSCDDTVVSGEQSNKKKWVVEFFPLMRHFRIEFFADTREKGKEPEIGYVHESRALSWK